MKSLVDGSPTDRGNKWRIDATYAAACQEILDEVYPPDLSGFTTADGGPNRAMVMKWFQQQKFGDSNARQMTATYVMIVEKKVPEAGDKEAKPRAKSSKRPALPPSPVGAGHGREGVTTGTADGGTTHGPGRLVGGPDGDGPAQTVVPLDVLVDGGRLTLGRPARGDPYLPASPEEILDRLHDSVRVIEVDVVVGVHRVHVHAVS